MGDRNYSFIWRFFSNLPLESMGPMQLSILCTEQGVPKLSWEALSIG